jgi:hypothetical protein
MDRESTKLTRDDPARGYRGTFEWLLSNCFKFLPPQRGWQQTQFSRPAIMCPAVALTLKNG